ncbi:MAG: hypothetical protein QG635_436 [Bacteroidota bacterium]|nr:hypothetical protein [Bacteroidota bacterium]
MKNFRFLLLVIIALLPLSFGCQEDSTNVVHAQGDYIMPLAVGNMWVGRVQRVDSNGNVLSTSYDTVRVDRDTIINGDQWFISNFGGQIFRNFSNWGLKTKYSYMPDTIYEFLKYPAAIGDIILRDTTIGTSRISGKTDTVVYGLEVADDDTTIAVPFGNYECYYYKPYYKKLDGSQSDIEVPLVGDNWYTPGYGIIKVIMFDISEPDAKIKLVWELVYLELY